MKNTDFAPYESSLLQKGFCQIPSVLDASECQAFIEQYDQEQLYRSTVNMQRYHFGKGQYRYFAAPLPEKIQALRTTFYELLANAANAWAKCTKVQKTYPRSYAEFEAQQCSAQHTKPTPLILKYTQGDYNCLHQDISGERYFPYQMIIVLNQCGRDFEGGEIILTQQRPRMQTIPHIFKLNQGDCLILSSLYHPTQGTRGYFRSVFRHGVGQITQGERYSLGVIFHNYQNK